MPVGIWCKPHVGSTVIVIITLKLGKDGGALVWFLVFLIFFYFKIFCVGKITLVCGHDGNVIRIFTTEEELIVYRLCTVKTVYILYKVVANQVFSRDG